jgi:hypothetical protein
VTGLLAAALRTAYTDLRRSGSSAAITVPLLPFGEMTALMGFRR